MTFKQKPIIFIVLALVAAALIALGIYLTRETSPVKDIDFQNDLEQVVALAERNKHWLAPTMGPEYSFEYKIANATFNHNPLNFGSLTTKVIRTPDGLVIGFTSYYMKKPTVGQVLYMAIHEDYRGKRHEQTLLEHAVEALTQMGATTIKMWVHKDNASARKLYERVGFRGKPYDDVFVLMTMEV